MRKVETSADFTSVLGNNIQNGGGATSDDHLYLEIVSNEKETNAIFVIYGIKVCIKLMGIKFIEKSLSFLLRNLVNLPETVFVYIFSDQNKSTCLLQVFILLKNPQNFWKTFTYAVFISL